MTQMENKVYALCVVGKTLGIEKMVNCIKDVVSQEEEQEFRRYVRNFFRNTYGQDQVTEMAQGAWNQKGMELGWEYLRAIEEAIRA